MASEAIATPQPDTLQKESTDLVTRASWVTAVASPEGYVEAVNLGKALRSMAKGVSEFWEPLKGNAHKSWKELVAREKSMLEPIEKAQRRLDSVIGDYLRKEEEKRLEAERIAKEATLKAEQDRALAEAQHLSEIGQSDEALKVIERAIEAPAPAVAVPSSVPKVAGTSQRESWSYEITDINLIPREYMVPDTVKIGQIVRAMKNTCKIPGIRTIKNSGLSMRS